MIIRSNHSLNYLVDNIIIPLNYAVNKCKRNVLRYLAVVPSVTNCLAVSVNKLIGVN